MRAFLCFAAVLVALATGAPASAERLQLKDPAKDVHSPEGGAGWSDEGSVVNTDLRRVVVRHLPTDVRTSARYVNLQKRASDEITFYAQIKTDAGTTFDVHVQVDWLFRSSSVHITNLSDYSLVECPEASARVRPGVEQISFVLPRTCLGDPTWIRFRGQAESYAESRGLFVDNAMGTSPEPTRWTRRVLAGQ